MLSMPPVWIWLTIIFAIIITYSYRAAFLIFSDKLSFPTWVKKALRFVPAAVIAALVIPKLIYQGGQIQMPWFTGGNLRLIAGILAIFVAWRTKNLFITLVSGMALLWALQWLSNFF